MQGHRPPYVSCIKIAGKPILPPLMTEQIIEECQELRRKAIQLEKRQERKLLFRNCLKDLQNLEQQTQDLMKPEEIKTPIISSLESQLSITNSQDMTNKMINLTRETIDVSEYNSDGVTLIKQTPKLIRSNSYTLDSPSPILLAHLEREAQKIADVSAEDASISPITVIESSPEEVKSKKVVETDIKVEEIKITAPIDRDIDPKIISVLESLPEDCRQTVLELITKQQNEASSKYEEYKKMKQKILDERINNDSNHKNDQPTSVSISSTQSLYYSISSNETPPPTFNENFEQHNNIVNLYQHKTQRRLFDGSEMTHHAATIINAAARGFLVRRLIRTEKVQVLIETIKDALLCAIQLHGAEIIDEADVELHRRLIQQVSAACYAFHDIFFSLSIKEQMNIIAVDRQRKIEKAKRPPSTRSSRSSLIATPR